MKLDQKRVLDLKFKSLIKFGPFSNFKKSTLKVRVKLLHLEPEPGHPAAAASSEMMKDDEEHTHKTKLMPPYNVFLARCF